MSHLKESIILSFTVDAAGIAYEMIFPSVTKFSFNTNFGGSYAHLEGAAPSGGNVEYIVRNETTPENIGTITITQTTGAIAFATTGTLTVALGDVITIKAAAGYSMGAFGASLVGER